MYWSESRLDEYLRKELAGYERTPPFFGDRELGAQIVRGLREGLVRMNSVLPERGSSGRPSLAPILTDLPKFYGPVLVQAPDDVQARWALIGYALKACDNDFGRDQLEELVKREPTDVRWLAAAALWVVERSGFDTTLGLRGSLRRLTAQIDGFDALLDAYSQSKDPYLARMARVGSAVLSGRSIPELMLPFRLILAQTIAWCSVRADLANPRESLWTLAFRPSRFPKDADAIDLYRLSPTERLLSIGEVVEARARALAQLGLLPESLADDLAGGRLLLFETMGSLADGAAEYATRGFFDVDTTPAWDTWVCYVRDPDTAAKSPGFGDFVVSWVPPRLVDLVQEGVRVDPMGCVSWAEDIDIEFTRSLRTARFL